jgi:hypothetical protein
VEGSGGRLHDEELHNLYSVTYTIRMMKSRRMRLAEYVAHVGEMRNSYKILVGKSQRRDHSDDLGVDWKIILEWMLGK